MIEWLLISKPWLPIEWYKNDNETFLSGVLHNDKNTV